jgi:hypothetical protein
MCVTRKRLVSGKERPATGEWITADRWAAQKGARQGAPIFHITGTCQGWLWVPRAARRTPNDGTSPARGQRTAAAAARELEDHHTTASTTTRHSARIGFFLRDVIGGNERGWHTGIEGDSPVRGRAIAVAPTSCEKKAGRSHQRPSLDRFPHTLHSCFRNEWTAYHALQCHRCHPPHRYSTRLMRWGLKPRSAALPLRARAARALFRLRISRVSSRSLPPRPMPSIFTLRV